VRGGLRILVLLVAGVSGAMAGPGFPLEVEKLISKAVVLREVATISFPRPEGMILVGIQDLNGDGFPDLVVTGDCRVQTLFGDGRGGFAAGPWVYLAVREYKEGEVIPTRPLIEDHETRQVPYEIEEWKGRKFVPQEVWITDGVLVDLDADGILDLVISASSFAEKEKKLHLLRGLGGGRFARAASLPFPEGKFVSPFWAVAGQVFFSARNEDEPARVYRLSAPTGLDGPRLEKLTEGSWILRWVGDINGDGVADLVVSTKREVVILMGEGDGDFREGARFSPPVGEISGVEVLDVDGDGFMDLVIGTPTGVVTALWRESAYVETFSLDLRDRFSLISLADLTGDGIPDLLAQRLTGFFEFLLLPGDGQGGFLGSVAELVVPDGILMEPWFVDLNLDGLLDVVFADLAGRKIRVYLNGQGLPGRSLHPLPGALLAVGDFSGNGSPDILVADVARPGVGVFWNDGRGGLVYWPLADLPNLPLAGALAPGRAYVLLPSQLVALDPTGKVQGKWGVPGGYLPLVVLGDWDEDGKEDVAVPAKGQLFVLWAGKSPRTYAWPEGEVSFLAPGHGRLWAVSIGEYADLVEVKFPKGELVVSAPALQLEVLPLTMTSGDLDGDGIVDPVVLGAELGVKVEGEEATVFPERIVAGMALSSLGPRVEAVPGFPKDHLPWPFLGAVVGTLFGKPHLVYTTSAGGGVFLVPWNGGWGEPIRVDVPAGPVLGADLDGNGEPEILAATVGLGTLLAVLWNGGAP